MTVIILDLLFLTILELDIFCLSKGALISPNPIQIGKKLTLNMDMKVLQKLANATFKLKDVDQVGIRKMIDLDERERDPNYIFINSPSHAPDKTVSFFDGRLDLISEFKVKGTNTLSVIVHVPHAKCYDIGILELELEWQTGDKIKDYTYMDFNVRKPQLGVHPHHGPYTPDTYITIACTSNATVADVELELWMEPPHKQVLEKLPFDSKLMGYSEAESKLNPTWPPVPLRKESFRICSPCKQLDQYVHRLQMVFRVDRPAIVDCKIKCVSKITTKFLTLRKLQKDKTDVYSTELRLSDCINGSCKPVFGVRKATPYEIALRQNDKQKGITPAQAKTDEQETERLPIATLVLSIVLVVLVIGIVVMAAVNVRKSMKKTDKEEEEPPNDEAGNEKKPEAGESNIDG